MTLSSIQIRKCTVIAIHITVLTTCFYILSTGEKFKTGNVTGVIRDIKTHKGISNVRITLCVGLITYCVTTNNTGNYFIEDVPAGNNFPMVISHKDYSDENIGITIQSERTTRKDITLQPVYLRLLYPNGGESIFAGSEVHILWASVGITSVRLEFSINGGKDWQLITGKTEAAVGRYIWDVPDIPSTKYLIRITDISDENISDTSDRTFKNTST